MWYISPSFDNGLILNNNGNITGIPNKIEQNTYNITFISDIDDSILISIIIIKIWRKPDSFSYGLTNINSSIPIIYSFYPIIDCDVLKYYILFLVIHYFLLNHLIILQLII